jgi:hypothetical protein
LVGVNRYGIDFILKKSLHFGKQKGGYDILKREGKKIRIQIGLNFESGFYKRHKKDQSPGQPKTFG